MKTKHLLLAGCGLLAIALLTVLVPRGGTEHGQAGEQRGNPKPPDPKLAKSERDPANTVAKERPPAASSADLTREILALGRSGHVLRILELLEAIPPEQREAKDIMIAAEACGFADFERTWKLIESSKLGNEDEGYAFARLCTSAAMKDAAGFEKVRAKIDGMLATGGAGHQLLERLYGCNSIPWNAAVSDALAYENAEAREAAVKGLANRLQVSSNQQGWDISLLDKMSPGERSAIAEALGSRLKWYPRGSRTEGLETEWNALMASTAGPGLTGEFLKGASGFAPQEAWRKWADYCAKNGGGPEGGGNNVTTAILDNVARESYESAISSISGFSGMTSEEKIQGANHLLSGWLQSGRESEAIAWWEKNKDDQIAASPALSETIFRHYLSKGRMADAEQVLNAVKDEGTQTRLRAELRGEKSN